MSHCRCFPLLCSNKLRTANEGHSLHDAQVHGIPQVKSFDIISVARTKALASAVLGRSIAALLGRRYNIAQSHERRGRLQTTTEDNPLPISTAGRRRMRARRVFYRWDILTHTPLDCWCYRDRAKSTPSYTIVDQQSIEAVLWLLNFFSSHPSSMQLPNYIAMWANRCHWFDLLLSTWIHREQRPSGGVIAET